jgi:toxin ParE1/3/4
MLKIRLSETAESDLEAIWRYTFSTWGLNQAQKYIGLIEHSLHLLLDNPDLGQARPDIKEGYRSLPVEKHLIFYQIGERYIDIVAIVHVRMDLKNHPIKPTLV